MNKAVIVHRIPGRVRLRIPDRRGDDAYFSDLADRLNTIEGVQGVSANAATGSIVLQFKEAWERIFAQFREHGLDLGVEQKKDVSSERTGVKSVRLVTGREINFMFMVGMGLVAVGIVQAMRGNVGVPSITAFWYAIEVFHKSARLAADTRASRSGRAD